MDVEHQELYVANPVTHEISGFRATDSGNVAPIRSLKGPHTQLSYPHGVFVDTKNDEVVVANFGNHSSTIYRRTASGDAAPSPADPRRLQPMRPLPCSAISDPTTYDTKRNEFLTFN